MRLISPLRMLRGPTGVGLVTDSGSGTAVLETLQRFRLRVEVSLEAEPGPIAEVWGPESAAVVEAAGGISPVPGAWVTDGESVVADLPFRHVSLARWLIVGIDAKKLIAAGAHPVGEAAATAARIEAGEARMGIDIDTSTIPQEAGLTEGAVDFTKGCYLGQELVARIESRGHVNRRLRSLRCAAGDTPPSGAALLVEGRQVGTLTSAAMSPDVGAPVGLGLVRSEVDIGTAVEVGWSSGATTAIVGEVPLAG